MPISWKSKILLAKIETTYGTDATPAGATDAILAIDVKLTPMEGNDVSRELDLPYLSAQGSIPTELHSKIEFKVELAGSGMAGTAPAWGKLLRACACAETSAASTVTYNPVSAGHESVTIYLWIGSTLYKLRGSRGTATFRLNAQGIPYVEFAFTGLFGMPTETARVTPTLTGFKKPKVVSSTNTPTYTINGTSFVMRSFAMMLGNAVENRFLVGSDAVVITDRAESIETTVEALPVTTFNPFSLASAQTQVPVNLVHGSTAGSTMTLNAPAAQVQRLQGLENAQNVKEWPLRLVPLPVSGTGNDQWTLTLS